MIKTVNRLRDQKTKRLSLLAFRLTFLPFYLFTFLPVLNAFATFSNEQAFPAELEEDLSSGTTAIYHLNFEKAEKHFKRAIQLQPEHPAPYFFLMMLNWYRLTYDSLLHNNPALEKQLEEQAETTIAVAKRFSKNPPTEAIATLYWGGALGAKGWFYVARSRWLRAYFAGRKGYAQLLKVIELDPEIYDAYLGIGMYEYYAATLGPVLKVLASFAIRGDKEKAFQSLKLAELKSRYVRTEASYFLWNAAMDEGHLIEAEEKVKAFLKIFPESPLFRWCEIQTLFYQREWQKVLQKGEEYLALAFASPQSENSLSPYAVLASKVLYHCGVAALNLKDYGLAKKYFDRTIDQPAEFPGWKVMAYLRRGELFDLEGKRADALGKYKTVRRYPEFWNSYRTARERMRKPFQVGKEDPSTILYSPLEFWKKELK